MESFLEKPKRMGPVTRSYIRFPGGSTRIWKGVDESVVGERLRPCDGWTGTLHRRGEGGIWRIKVRKGACGRKKLSLRPFGSSPISKYNKLKLYSNLRTNRIHLSEHPPTFVDIKALLSIFVNKYYL
jgi:hypothetical protein